MKNVLILIDVWDKLNHKLEVRAKNHIIHFINLIKDRDNWKIYISEQHPTLDRYPDFPTDIQILGALAGTNFMYAHGSEPFEHIDWDNTHFYFAGFHTQHCLFDKRLGIRNFWRQAPAQYRDNYSILADCTAANMIDPNDQRLTIPISPYDLPDDVEGIDIKSKLVPSERVFLG
jgi:hypothetical protein